MTIPKNQRLSEDEVHSLFTELSNWTKWGRDDEKGALNYLTPENVIEAARLVQSGRVVSIAHDIVVGPADEVAGPMVPQSAWVMPRGEFRVRPHGYAPTHLDPLTHTPYRGTVWNGRPWDEAMNEDGSIEWASILPLSGGIVTRGVLLDVALARGVEHFEREDTVTIDDLIAAEKLSGTTVRRGNAVLIRTGMGMRINTREDVETRVGLGPECARWLQEKEVAVFGSDCPEKVPSGYGEDLLWPFHQVVLVAMGLVLLDNAAMEPLAQACAAEKRNEFMFTTAPIRIPKGDGSAVNPLAVF